MIEVELHIQVTKEGKLFVNPERINLLRIIEKTGSLLTASKEIGISYNKAWKMLEVMNNTVDKPVVEKLRGGKGGGGAVITDFGKLILKEYEAMEEEVNRFAKKLNTEINL